MYIYYTETPVHRSMLSIQYVYNPIHLISLNKLKLLKFQFQMKEYKYPK